MVAETNPHIKGGKIRMNTAQEAVTLRAKRDKEEKIVWKQMTIRVPHEVHRALKVRVAEEDSTVGETVERLIREYLVKGRAVAEDRKQRKGKGRDHLEDLDAAGAGNGVTEAPIPIEELSKNPASQRCAYQKLDLEVPDRLERLRNAQIIRSYVEFCCIGERLAAFLQTAPH